MAGLTYWYFEEIHRIDNANFILIDKATMTLSQYNYKGKMLQQYKVATGRNYGNKIKKGDLKTPEGVFRIQEIIDASTWNHDFDGDNKGPIEGAYGPLFIRLNVPNQKGIGIHGTHDNSSIGKRASEGCIRLRNEDLLKLVKNIELNSIVVITPGSEDAKYNSNPYLPNNSDKQKVSLLKDNKVILENKRTIK